MDRQQSEMPHSLFIGRVEVEGEASLACQQLFRGMGMGGNSIGRVCLDVTEVVVVVDRMRERWWGHLWIPPNTSYQRWRETLSPPLIQRN